MAGRWAASHVDDAWGELGFPTCSGIVVSLAAVDDLAVSSEYTDEAQLDGTVRITRRVAG
ncbi:MAG: hypothetical protein M0Z27_05035 [Thermaerobacter sp.]|nr:hypothetical protein [Thermaerobacter sp.]MDA8145415.1 hypothetical protein [Thermaerobacter sp.]